MGLVRSIPLQRAGVTLVWILLVLALVVMLCTFAIVLFRKVIGVVSAFSDLIGQTAILDGVHRSEPEQRPLPAAVGGLAAASSVWRTATTRRRERRALRRATRMARAKLLMSTDPASIERFRR